MNTVDYRHSPPRASAPPHRRVSRHQVRQHIEKLIFSGGIQPGQRIVQTRIASEMDVACSVVREALMELHASGLVEAIDNRGAVVVRVNPERLMESFEAREAFDGLVARRCCSRMTLQQLRELRQLAEQIHRRQQSGQRLEGASLDAEFHRRLLEISGSQLLQRLHHTFWWLGKLATGKDTDFATTRRLHLALLDAIAAGDKARAQRYAHESIRAARQYFEERLAEDQNFLPEWVT